MYSTSDSSAVLHTDTTVIPSDLYLNWAGWRVGLREHFKVFTWHLVILSLRISAHLGRRHGSQRWMIVANVALAVDVLLSEGGTSHIMENFLFIVFFSALSLTAKDSKTNDHKSKQNPYNSSCNCSSSVWMRNNT